MFCTLITRYSPGLESSIPFSAFRGLQTLTHLSARVGISLDVKFFSVSSLFTFPTVALTPCSVGNLPSPGGGFEKKRVWSLRSPPLSVCFGWCLSSRTMSLSLWMFAWWFGRSSGKTESFSSQCAILPYGRFLDPLVLPGFLPQGVTGETLSPTPSLLGFRL